MNTITVDELLSQIAAAIYDRRLGYLAVTGTLTDWRRHRYGEQRQRRTRHRQPTHRPPAPPRQQARRRRHRDRLAHAGHDPARPTTAIAHGQMCPAPRWGLQLEVGTIDLITPTPTESPTLPRTRDNHRGRWPDHIDTIGLVDPIDGEDARTDVLAVLGHLALTVIEHRVPVTGTQAASRISRALDQLALDERPDLTH